MTHCTGMLGKRCSCGLFHGEGGRVFDAQLHEAPTFPFAPGVIEDPDDDDFLHQQTVFDGLWIVGRWVLLVIAIACAAWALWG